MANTEDQITDNPSLVSLLCLHAVSTSTVLAHNIQLVNMQGQQFLLEVSQRSCGRI